MLFKIITRYRVYFFFCNFFVFFNFLFLFCACKGLKVARIVTAFAEPLTHGTCMPTRPNQTQRHWSFERINCAAIPRPAGNRRTERRLGRRSLIYTSEYNTVRKRYLKNPSEQQSNRFRYSGNVSYGRFSELHFSRFFCSLGISPS